MEQFVAINNETYYWSQPKALERFFELRTPAAELAGLLVWEKAFGTLATAYTAAGYWSFKRVGFWNPRITVRKPGEDNDLAVFYPRFFGNGTLEIVGGDQFRWESLNFWATQWGFFNPSDDQVLVKFIPGSDQGTLGDVFKNQAIIQIDLQRRVSDLPLLISLGWYLMILRLDDSAASVTATTAAIG